MTDVLKLGNQYQGLAADKTGVTGQVGETYLETDTGKRTFWYPPLAAWLDTLTDPSRLRFNKVDLAIDDVEDLQGLAWAFTGGASKANRADGIYVIMPASSTISLTRDIGSQQKVQALLNWYMYVGAPGNANFYAQVRFEDNDTGKEWIARNWGAELEIWSSPPLTKQTSHSSLYLLKQTSKVEGVINLATGDMSMIYGAQEIKEPQTLGALGITDIDRIIFEVVNNDVAQKQIYLVPDLILTYE